VRTFVYLVRPAFDRAFLKTATKAQREVADRHGDYLTSLAERGKLLLAGRCSDGPFGVVVIQASNEAEARLLMKADPSVRAGVQEAELHPFEVFILRG
jgi:uncharacterized protein YciI